jgi:aryl-alcohol dehydrogenase (NADP+)
MYQLEEAVGALTLQLGDDERRSLEEPYVPHPVLGH